MPEQLWFTAFLNHYLAGPVTALMIALHLAPTHPEAPITNFVAMELMVFGILLLVFILVRMDLSVDRPGALQHVAEVFEEFVDDQCEQVIGHKQPQFVTFLATLFVFILIMNLIGLIPTLESPTGSVPVPFGLAIVAFIYYHVQGVKKQGVLHYMKHFLGPMPVLAPLMLPIELISHTARMLSLTVRLWANMFAGDLITLVFLSLVPLAVPLIFLSLHIFVAFLQAYIFMLLAIIYLQGATAAEEH